MNRDVDNSAVNLFCEFISYNFRLFKTEILFERIITVVLSMAVILISACSLAADAVSPSSSDKSKQADPFSEKDRKAGDRAVKVVNGVEFAFRWCPFIASGSENDHDSANQLSNSPQGFWIMETEVTVGMFRAFVKDTGYEPHGDTPQTVNDTSAYTENGNFYMKEGLSWDKPGFEQNDRHPVICVSWEDAVEFNKWLAEKLKKNVLLPTEEQWLCACRADAENTVISNLEEFAWYWKNSNAATHPVGTKKPNAWGLFDMHGNAWEWCSDIKSAERRVRRGGGYGTNSQVCGSAFQLYNSKTYRCSDVGFRCAIEPDPVPIDLGIGTQAGERKTCTVNGVEFAFRWCPPGTFTMGSPESEKGRKNDEQQHQVTLTKGFWMMETEVTPEQWKAIMEKRLNKQWYDDKSPVREISWNECMLFCQKCTALGLRLQLPTEAQWEYACRAGTTEAYAGDIDEMGWTINTFISQVRMKMPNDWGLYDMHGNVYEWCSDWYASYPRQNVTDPEGPRSGTHRVMRGGCASRDSKYSRSANRGKCVPDLKNDLLGFRCIIGKGVSSTYVPKTSSDEPKSKVTHIAIFGQGVKAGERKTAIVNGVEFAFRWCPPGAFMMGSPEDEKGRNNDEQQHKVTLTKGFWMMETEVSQKQWKAIMDTNISTFNYDTFPVETVSWNSCQNFCQKCSNIGLPVQLPTEAQWEYACRAGTTGMYAGVLDDMAWHLSNSDRKPHPVGKKKPNAWGLYDMHGNVWEWCQDWYGDYPSDSVTDPTGPESGSNRVIRGDDWGHSSSSYRSALRNKLFPDGLGAHLGFRCVIIPND